MSDTFILRAIPQTLQTSAKLTEHTVKIILDIIAQNQENELVKSLLEHGKVGGNLDFEICRSFAVRDFDEKLSQYKIPHAIIYDKVSGLSTIVTRDIDRESVLNAKNEMLVEQKRLTRLSPNEFSRLNAGKNIEIIRGRSAVEAKLFQQAAKKYGFTIALQKNSLHPDKIDIHYAAQDKEKAADAMNRVISATVGLTGQRTNDRVGREISFQQNMLKDIQDAEKDFYVVSKANPDEYIHFDKDGFQYFKRGVLTRDESRQNNSFVSAARSHISGMITPLVFSKKEFEVSPDERKKLVRSVKIDVDKSHSIRLEQQAKDLIKAKISHDKGSENVIQKEFYSADASFNKLFARDEFVPEDTRELIRTLDSLDSYDKAIIKNYVGRELPFYNDLSNDARNESLDFYLVANKQANEYIHFGKDGLEHYRGDRLVDSCLRTDQAFEETVFKKAIDFSAPISLSKTEFEVPKAELKQMLRNEPTALDAQTKRLEDLESKARDLIEKKLSLDNDEQIQVPSSFYNQDVSFGEFFSIEQINEGKLSEIVATFDKLEDKEKLLVKNYIKDTFEKVQSIEVSSAYIDPAIKAGDLEAEVARMEAFRPEDVELPFSDTYDAEMYDDVEISDD